MEEGVTEQAAPTGGARGQEGAAGGLGHWGRPFCETERGELSPWQGKVSDSDSRGASPSALSHLCP